MYIFQASYFTLGILYNTSTYNGFAMITFSFGILRKEIGKVILGLFIRHDSWAYKFDGKFIKKSEPLCPKR